MGTSGNADRGLNPPHPPPYPTSSSVYPPRHVGTAPFQDRDGTLPAASGAPPPGFVDVSSAAPAGGYPPTIDPSSSTGYYPQPEGHPARRPSVTMPMLEPAPLPPFAGAPPLPGTTPLPQRAPSLPELPTPAKSFPTPSVSTTSFGYPTDEYPPSGAVPPMTSRPDYEPSAAAGYSASGYSSSSRGVTGYSSYGSAGSGAPYDTPSGRPTLSGAMGYGSSSRYCSGTQARTSCYSPGRGTIKAYRNFNAQQDAEALRKALKGWTTDHSAVINIVCARSDYQRQEIVRSYKQSFGRDLVGDMKSTLRTNFEDVIVGLLYPLHEYLARELRKAVAGLGTDEDCLIEILCTHSNEDIRMIKDQYHRIFKKDLEKDIIGDTSGDFRRLLVSMCNAQREENIPLDHARARSDASELHRAGVLRWGTDVSAFNRIIATQSYEQLRLVFREYNALANHTVMEAIKNEMSGDLRRAFLAIVKCVYSTPFYFAEKLYDAIKGLGTNDKVLKRVILSRCERDLELIKQEYLDKYKMTLSGAIQSDTSGNYRKALLAIVQGN